MGLRRFSDNPSATTPLTGSEIIPGIQSGVDVAMTAQDVADLGGASGGSSLDIITEASAFTASPGTHAGISRYIRAGGDITFDNSEGYSEGEVFNIRATAALELVEDGVTLTPTYGGTLDLEAGM